MDFSFSNISLTVPVKNTPNNGRSFRVSPSSERSKKQILSGVSANVSAGKMLAIIGSSGSGKSSLLDVISGRITKGGSVSGHLIINGSKIEPRSMKQTSKIGYVMQDDCFLPHLTVRETVSYAFALKCGSTLEKVPKDAIDSILKTLHLTKCSETYVGNQLIRGISGGERRRLSIAVELVTNPKILFLDEPTSGLDSVNSIRIIEIIKSLCESGSCTAIMSIHQPSSTIFHLFDQLMLLDKGKVVYVGDANEVLPYFSKLGFDCPNHMNPAEYILDIVLRDEDELYSEKDAEKGKIDFVGEFAKKYSPHEEEEGDSTISRSPFLFEPLKSSLLSQILILTNRTWKSTRRNESIMLVRSGAAILIAILVGSIFYQVPDNPEGNENRVHSILFLMCVFSLFCLPAIGKLVEDRILFYRGRASGEHGTLAYFIATVVVEIPILFVIAIGYGSISYWMVGLQRDATNFITFLAIIFMVINVGFSLSQAIASAVKTTNMAIAVYMIVLVYSLLLGGFMVGKSDLPGSLQWLVQTSYFYYGFEGLMKNEFEKRSDGTAVLQRLDFLDADPMVNLAALTVFFIIFRVFAFLCLSSLRL